MYLRNLRRHTWLIVALMLFVLMYLGLNLFILSPYTGDESSNFVHRCHFDSSKPRTSLLELAYRMHSVLENMGIEHWLIYRSLWGPLHGFSGPLPWDYEVSFGMEGDGNFSKVSRIDLLSRLTAAGLVVTDKTTRSGNFFVERNGEKGNLILFYNWRGVMTRAGYETWIFFVNWRLHNSFPAVLVQKPLPKVLFGFFNISIPRGGIEIMKYLYPFSWWKEGKPANCDNEHL